MKKLISILLSLLMIAAVLPAGTAFAQDTVTVNLKGNYNQTEARSMLSMVNSFRKSSDAWYKNQDGSKHICSNLSNYTYDYELERAAMQRAAEICVKFSHTRPNGESCFSVSDYTYGENIAIGVNSASFAYSLWREDNFDYSGQGHRRSMLSDSFTCIGIGYFEMNGVGCWVQEFGAENSNAPETAAKNGASSVAVEINKSDIQECGVAYYDTKYTVKLGSKAKLPVTAPAIIVNDSWLNTPINLDATPSYSGYDSTIIKIESGKMKGLRIGKTKLTVTYNTPVGVLSRTFTVTVTAPAVKASAVKKLTAAKKAFKVTLKSVSGVDGYEIQYSLKKSFKKSKKVTTTKTTKKIKRLKKKKTYYVRVRAYKTVNGVKYYSKWSKAKTIKTK